MPPKGLYLMLAISVGCLLKTSAQEYPFIKYTPKDGLINSRIRNVYQDSKGRLFFMTANGLSVYDGARFNNYSIEDGLANPLVNDVIEISPDSLLLATNTVVLNLWVRGKIKKVITADGYCPVINRFYRATNGVIYVASDQGLYFFRNNRFVQIQPEGMGNGKMPVSFDNIQEVGNCFLLKEDADISKRDRFYLLDKNTNKIKAHLNETFHSIVQVPQKNVLLCANSLRVRCFDLEEASRGILKEVALPSVYQSLKYFSTNKLTLDKTGNLWCVHFNSILRIAPDGHELVLDKTTGLDVNNINGIFVDYENVLWIQTDGSGLIKLANNNVEIVTGLFGKSATGISSIQANSQSDTSWLFNYQDHSIYGCTPKQIFRYWLKQDVFASNIQRYQGCFYLSDPGNIYLACPDKQDKNKLSATLVYHSQDSIQTNFTRGIMHDNCLYFPGVNLLVIKPGEFKFIEQLPGYADQIVFDNHHQLWVATRTGDLLRYTIQPARSQHFLVLQHNYKHVLPILSPRSLTVDTNGRVWIGTRYEGLYCFEFKDTSLASTHHFTSHEGLTDNFIYHLACDGNNNVWAGTQSGLDKISLKNGEYIVEGVTRNNNIFQLIQSVAISKNNQVWTLGNSGSILRISNNLSSSDYRPVLQITRIKTVDTTFETPPNGLSFFHRQNNLTFEAAAPSFIDEKQITFSYALEGSASVEWSKPSTEAAFNFINLAPGKYTLHIKALFPVPDYPPQRLDYNFLITPPWWQTWWFRMLMGITIMACIASLVRLYYQRKLEKQKIIFEKQQAVEQERTRIAMEMHDDLGSGLTTIRYLAGGLPMQSPAAKDKAEKIVSSAKTLVDNMNDIIWTMKSDNNTLEEALAYIRKQAAEQLETAGIEYHLDFPKDIPSIIVTNELKRNLLLISKEAIHNIVKHAAATNVSLSASLESGRLKLKIIDNGKGIDLHDMTGFGNGLKNMRRRANEIRALLDVQNTKGTTIIVTATV